MSIINQIKGAPNSLIRPLRYIRNSIPKKYLFGKKYNKAFLETYNLLQESQWWTKDKIEEYQFQQLSLLLNHAYNTVPYYKTLLNEYGIKVSQIQNFEDYKIIPLLTKDIIRSNNLDLISSVYKKNQIRKVATSGSTGKPIDLYFDKNRSIGIEEAFVKFIYDRINYDENDKVISFRDAQIVLNGVDEYKNIYWVKIPGKNKLLFSNYHLNDKFFRYYIEQIDAYQPAWIKTFPSSLFHLAKYIQNKNYNPFKKLKGVIFMSENIYDYQLSLFKDVFPNTKMLSVYGHSEMGAIAGTCEYSFKYHMQHEYGYSEFINVGNSTHELVTTGFSNYVMPLLRYKTNDLFELSTEQCECGRSNILINNIEGRLQDVLYTIDKRPISDIVFDFSGNLSKVINYIKQFQFVQESFGKCTLLIVPENGFNDKHALDIIENFKQRFSNTLDVKVKCVKEIPTTGRGKQRVVLQKMKIDV